MNWIIPKKLLAFSTPRSSNITNEGFKTFKPENYIPIFKNFGVKLIIRLNKPLYDKEVFTQAGFDFKDMYFIDGSTPNISIIQNFLSLVENCDGAVAVHCKAGLGRTGTLISIYVMKNYRFCASDFIAWIRILRPGSILGPQ